MTVVVLEVWLFCGCRLKDRIFFRYPHPRIIHPQSYPDPEFAAPSAQIRLLETTCASNCRLFFWFNHYSHATYLDHGEIMY